MKIILLFSFIFMFPVLMAQHDHSGHSVKDSVRKKEARVPVEVPPEQQAKIGLKTTPVREKTLTHTIRTVGTVTSDERTEAHIHSRINGWIENIFADFIGASVKKGGKLYSLYSPELVSTQEEFLAATKQGGVGKEIAKAALERLKLWGVPEKEIERLKKTGKAAKTITFESPVKGFVIKKSAIQGMYITPGMELYLIADLSRVWIQVTLYEYDVSVISTGDEAEVELPYDQKANIKGKITYISPEVEVESRTVKARLEVENENQRLKPGMFANVILKKDLGKSLVIPDDAVIDSGIRKIAFVQKDKSWFEPRELKVGPRVDGSFIVLSGIKKGERVVTSAHFFLDAESKLKAAIEKGTPAPSGHGGH